MQFNQFEAAKEIGIRFHGTRGSMSLSEKDGGLPPDSVVQTDQEILKDSRRVIEKYHDSSPFAMQRVALAPGPGLWSSGSHSSGRN
jgi:hypothetical protein